MNTTITLSCPVCEDEFEQRLATYNYELKRNPDRKFYCSVSHSRLGKNKPLESKTCVGCGIQFSRKSSGKKDKLLYCSRQCSARNVQPAAETFCKWCAKQIHYTRKVCDDCRSGKSIENETLQFIKDNYSVTSFHGRIRSHSRKVYLKENPNGSCYFCDYSLYLEVAHIKPVSEFDLSAKLLEVNALTNLIGLCRNHHWELDHGYISMLD